MKLDIFNYEELQGPRQSHSDQHLQACLMQKGIVGIERVPNFEACSAAYINAARQFAALPTEIKARYAPRHDLGSTAGYELGAEQFKNAEGLWQTDNYKASYYAHVPNQPNNQWPTEVDLKTPYLALGQLILAVGKEILNRVGINDKVGLDQVKLTAYGRMLHYHMHHDADAANPNWCGAHLDHGVFTGLAPAHYFRDGVPVAEPDAAGLYVMPTDTDAYQKFSANRADVLLFQVGEFGQLLANDRIRATRHLVRKAPDGFERFAFALFFSPADETRVQSTSVLTQDARYRDNADGNGAIRYAQWQDSSYARYRA